MDVLTAMWASQTHSSTEPGNHGRCARCATQGAEQPATSAVSKSFTGYDDWADPRGRFLCDRCAWAYSTPALRSYPHQVTREPATATVLSRARLAGILAAGAVGPDEALVVPLRPGRKHLVPGARWGRVTTDNACFPWGRADAHLLTAVTHLRTRGFGSRMLTEPAPPFAVLARQPRDQWANVLADWDRLAPWRDADSPWLPLALHATTPSTKEDR
ncbi:hypothetical protein ACFQ80_05985 [Isoptericola sp. NPDC056578]|uniref:hypothetical protein n=1 Tax=Isoptericola sp. NPDC056578 TaxID=3345870 RepID=UPI00369FB9A3